MAKKKRGNIVVYGILILIIAGLGGLGATNFGGGSTTVATVGDATIVAQDYARALDAQLRQLSERTGQRLTFQQAQSLGADRAALSRLVRDTAIAEEARELGLSVGDETVRARILDVPAFQGAGGFQREAYEFALDRAGFTVREFETQIRNEASAGLLSAAVSSGLQAPDAFIDTLFDFARETRDIAWVRLTEDNLIEPLPEPSDDELRAFHAEHVENYVSRETRIADVAWIAPEDVADGLEVSDDQARALYDARIEDFVQPPRVLAERLVFRTEEAAAEALARIETGEATFDELVVERGLSIDDVDLGEVTEDDLGATGPAVFALEEPGVTGPLPSSLGPALYRVNAILEAREVPFEEVRDELATEAALDRARRLLLETGARIEDLLAGGAGVEDIAAKTELRAERVEFDGLAEDGVMGYENFRDAIGSMEPGALPELVPLEDGGLAVVALAEIVSPAPLDFEAAREDVAQDWAQAETEARLRSRAEALGGDLDTAGVEVTRTKDLQRGGFVDGTPPGFTETAFAMEEGETRILGEAGEVWALTVEAVNPADREAAEAALILERLRAEATQGMASDALDAFIRAIMAKTPVSVNQSAINAVHAQMQ